MNFNRKFFLFLILVAILFLAGFLVLNKPTTFAVKEENKNPYVPGVPEGNEINYYGYKYSNTNGVILSVPSYVSCSWKNPEKDDGWKICEVIFEVTDADKATKILSNPRVDLSFENAKNIRNVDVLFSDDFSIVEELHKEFTPEVVPMKDETSRKVYSKVTGNVVIENKRISQEDKVKLVINKQEEIINKRDFDSFFKGDEINVLEKNSQEVVLSKQDIEESKGFFRRLTGRVVEGFDKDPSSINPEEPFAVMVRFEIPKYESNSFDFKLVDSDTGLTAFIDPDISACGTLDTTNAVYTLTQDISSTGNCFTIGAENVTLDCQGNSITYATSGLGGYGVYSNYSFTKIRNCNFIEGNSGNSDGKGIYFSGSNNAEISGNTFYSQATSGFIIYVGSSEEVEIKNNVVNVSGSYFEGIYADAYSDYINVHDNIINFSSIWGGSGIYLESLDSGIAFRNTLEIKGSPSDMGISLQSTTNSNVSYNNILNTGESSYGIYLTLGSSEIVDRNTINYSSFSSAGIYAEEHASDLTISNNHLETYNGGGVGIYFADSNDILITGNILGINGGSSGSGIYIGAIIQATLSNNQLSLVGDSFEGIILEDDLIALLTDNTINISGQGTFGISTYSPGEINMTRTTINLLSQNSAGIQLETTSSDTYLYDSAITSSGSNSKAVYIAGDSTTLNSFNSFFNSNGGAYDFYLEPSISSGNWNFTNTTIQRKYWPADSSGNLMVYWYLDAVVKYLNGTLIEGADVSIKDSNQEVKFTGQTNSNGEISTQTLLSYLQTGESSINNYSYFNISASFGSFYYSELVNLDENKNLIFTFDPSTGKTSSEEGSPGSEDITPDYDWEESCNPRWDCSEWSECSKDGTQERTCVNKNPSCNAEKPKTVKRCTQKDKIKKILFDIKLDTIKKRIVLGDNLFVVVSLFNLGAPGQVNVSLSYEITNSLNEIVYYKEDIVPVETQMEFIKEFDTSGMPLGDYYLSSNLEYEEQTEPARAEIRFVIREERSGWFIFWIVLGSVAFIGAILYFLVFWKGPKRHSFFYKEIKKKLASVKGKNKQETKKIYEEIKQDFKEVKDEKEKKELYPKINELLKLTK